MRIEDFSFNAPGEIVQIPLLNGEDSGETVTLKSADTDAAVKAGRAFAVAYTRIAQDGEELADKCRSSGNMLEYNVFMSERLEPINAAFAAALVHSWSLEDECNADNVKMLLSQHTALVDKIISTHTKAKDALQEK